MQVVCVFFYMRGDVLAVVCVCAVDFFVDDAGRNAGVGNERYIKEVLVERGRGGAVLVLCADVDFCRNGNAVERSRL